MPYVYSVYKLVQSDGPEGYVKELAFKGTPEDFVKAGFFASYSGAKDAFGQNIRHRMRGQPTRKIWEREWFPAPGEPEPNSVLPDKLDIVIPPKKRASKKDITEPPEEKQIHAPDTRQVIKAATSEPQERNYDATSRLAQDVHDLMQENALRAEKGKKPLSYGKWRAGIG